MLHVSRIRVKGHFNHLKAELNPICHLLALLGTHHIRHVSRVRVKGHFNLVNKIHIYGPCRLWDKNKVIP